MYSPGGSEPGYVAPDPKDVDVFFAGGNNGSFLVRTDRRTGQSREVHPYPRMFSGEPASALVERVQWTFPIVFSPVDPNVLYTATQHVWKTTNGGQDWTQISKDLTRADPKTLGHSGGPITGDMNGPEVYATVFTLAPSKVDVNVLWTGSDDGKIHVTQNGGKTWADVTPKEMPDFGRVSIVDASAFNAGTAYAAVKRPLLGDQAPYLFRTHDFGKTWTKIVSGLKPNDYTHAIREDHKRRNMLYAGTQHGMYYSYDDGNTWHSLSLNLPDIPISDIWVEETDLVIATHGRSFYVLDDIDPLRQFGAPVASATDVFLFAPADAIRTTAGATIRYWVKQPAQNLTIEILDKTGAVVRTFGGAAATEPPAAGRGEAWRRRAAVPADVERRGRQSPAEAAGGRGGGRGGAMRIVRSRPEQRDLGFAVPGLHDVHADDPVGRGRRRCRTNRAAGNLHGAAQRERTNTDADVPREAKPPVYGRQRRRSPGTVRSGHSDPRQDERGQQRGDPDPRRQVAGGRSALEVAGRSAQDLRRHAEKEPQRDRGGDLPGAEPERPGSAQLPHQDQQPPRLALVRRHARRRTADRQRGANPQEPDGGAQGSDGSAGQGSRHGSGRVQRRGEAAGAAVGVGEVKTRRRN